MIELWTAVGYVFVFWCMLSAAGTITYILVKRWWP